MYKREWAVTTGGKWSKESERGKQQDSSERTWIGDIKDI